MMRLVLIGGLSLTAFGCGGSQPEVTGVTETGVTQVAKGADQSRCDFKGRTDRVVVVTKGPGAGHPNVRRVYAVGTDRKDGKRVLRCREVDTNLDGINDLIRTYNEKGEPLGEQADTNYNGRIDSWVQFANDRVAKAEFDRNADGKPDEFKVYSKGVLIRLQRDSRYDGKLDTWHVYEQGRLNRIGVDLDGDEKVDRWYRDEELRRQEEAEEAADQQGQAGSDQ